MSNTYIPEFDDGDYDDEEDEFELAMQECGQSPNGGCQLAGTEYCEFECPFRDEDLFEDSVEVEAL